MISAELDNVAAKIVDAAFIVHKNLGPGLLERVYEVCLAHELEKAGLSVKRQVAVPINYDGLKFDEGFRLDLLVNNSIVCELKAADKTNSIWQAQILSHMRLAEKKLGFLINFNVPLFKNGIQRFAI